MFKVGILAMKNMIVFPLAILYSLAFTTHGNKVDFQHVSFEALSLHANDESIQDVLETALNLNGIISVSAIPGFTSIRRQVLKEASLCARSKNSGADSTTMSDGTRRTSMVTQTIHQRKESFEVDSAECAAFAEKSNQLRSLISTVTDLFSNALSITFNTNGSHLLRTEDENKVYSNFSDMVRESVQLEHFHTYEVPSTREMTTIDMHVDQGLFIAFVPAVRTNRDGIITSVDATGEFQLQARDGTVKYVSFPDNGDVVVFLMGDAVNHFINPKLMNGRQPIWTPPHSLTIATSASEEFRNWYGRMVLPPSDALHSPGLTYGALRDASTRSLSSQEFGLGCSGNQYARELSEDQCTSNQLYCWHRCYDYTTEMNPDVCVDQGLQFNCTTQFNQIAPAGEHGDNNPGCISQNASMQTPFPTIAPKTPSSCPTTFETFVSSQLFEYSKNLDSDGSVVLTWEVTEAGALKARMMNNGHVGWMSIGPSNPSGGKNGMQGAHVIMAIVDEESYSESIIEEYKIHPTLSAFRHWSTPLATSSSMTSKKFTSDGCFSTLEFETSHIGDQALNLTTGNSMNEFIWAVHSTTWLVQYHDKRGVERVDLTTSEASYLFRWPITLLLLALKFSV